MLLTEYLPSHRDGLFRFLRRNFPNSPHKANDAYFDWRFARSPLGNSLDKYALLLEGSEVIGQAATIKDQLQIGRNWFDCVWLMDFIMDEAHRGGLGAVRLVRRIMQTNDIVLVSGAGPHMIKFYTSLKFRKIPTNRTWYIPLHPGAMVAATRPMPTWSKPLLWAADQVISPVQNLLSKRLKINSDITIEPGHVESAAMASILDANYLQGVVTNQRSVPLLSWRLEQCPVGQRRVIFARNNKTGDVVGYAALKWFDRPNTWKSIEIVDWIVPPNSPDVWQSIVYYAVQQAANEGLDFVRIRANETLMKNMAPLLAKDVTRESVDEIYVWSRSPEIADTFTKGPFFFTGLVSDRADYGADEWV